MFFFFTLFFTLERSVRTICCPFDPPFPWGNQPQVAKWKGGGASRRGERENSSLGFRICIRNLYACSGHEMKNVASFWRLSTWWTWSTWTLCHLSLADENKPPPPPPPPPTRLPDKISLLNNGHNRSLAKMRILSHDQLRGLKISSSWEYY